VAFSVPYQFSPGETAASAQVNANFQAIVHFLNSGGGGSFVPETGYIILPGGLIVQWGVATGVAADGSAATPVTFDLQFPNALLGKPICGVSNPYQTDPWAVGLATDTEIATGFNVNAFGAPVDSTVSVGYLAVGY
jgi:hypothetical protein